MDIGTLVKLPFSQEDRLCLVLDKKHYLSVKAEWTVSHRLLTTSFCGRVKQSRLSSGWSAQPYSLYSKYAAEACYELMCGDKRYWIRGDVLEMYGKKI